MEDFLCWRKRVNDKQIKLSRHLDCVQAFSLIEVIVVVVILAILTILALFFFQRHLMRSRDVRRKSDLDQIRTAFEEYYNDNRCYPPPEAVYMCGSRYLEPYLKEMPCDPLTKAPYLYQPLYDGYCKGYRLLAKLEIQDDKDIAGVGCSPTQGCDPNNPGFNWGVAVGAGVSAQDWGDFGSMPANWNYCLPTRDGPRCQSVAAEHLFYSFACRVAYSLNDGASCLAACDNANPPAPGVLCECRDGATHDYCTEN